MSFLDDAKSYPDTFEGQKIIDTALTGKPMLLDILIQDSGLSDEEISDLLIKHAKANPKAWGFEDIHAGVLKIIGDHRNDYKLKNPSVESQLLTGIRLSQPSGIQKIGSIRGGGFSEDSD